MADDQTTRDQDDVADIENQDVVGRADEDDEEFEEGDDVDLDADEDVEEE